MNQPLTHVCCIDNFNKYKNKKTLILNKKFVFLIKLILIFGMIEMILTGFVMNFLSPSKRCLYRSAKFVTHKQINKNVA